MEHKSSAVTVSLCVVNTVQWGGDGGHWPMYPPGIYSRGWHSSTKKLSFKDNCKRGGGIQINGLAPAKVKQSVSYV